MIQVVTDSVASIPQDGLKDVPIDVVSLFVNRNGVEYEDATMDVDAFYADIYAMLDDIPTSSQPSQHTLEDRFRRIAQAGDELIGVFVSTYLSGTYDSAVRAAQAVKSRIPGFKYALIDSLSCGFDEAFPVFSAHNAVKEGLDLSKCVDAVLHSMRATRFLFTPETLTFLQRGGRIGNAAALLGNLIKLAPVLTIAEGQAGTVAKVRSRKKALERMIHEFKADVAAFGLKSVVVHYIGDKVPAAEFAKSSIEPLVGKLVRVIPVSPVIGLHVGPAIALVYECERAMPYKFKGSAPVHLSLS
ncbi:MAG: DegV family protein [Eggerthellaceae bacterium]|nr:DegV family protein [Eggerthellaceae bacterium]